MFSRKILDACMFPPRKKSWSRTKQTDDATTKRQHNLARDEPTNNDDDDDHARTHNSPKHSQQLKPQLSVSITDCSDTFGSNCITS